MRVSKEKAAENRDALLDAASRLFRARGIDGVGVAEIAKAAGLTHGALYAHFKSKDELAAAAFEHGFAGNMVDTQEWAEAHNPKFEDFLDGLLSTRMRDSLETGCPMAASASEIGRQGEAVSTSFARSFEEQVGWLERSLERDIPAAERRRLAIAAVAAEIGAVAVSRAILKTDATLANDILDAVRLALGSAHQAAKARLA
ncbi:TetR/AcrR family transcriptional regulator [Dyella japonica]|uniref:TetR/AcrR family transcriptional repressor of nem operon n=1 Tax=Dyella japonica TaxID=231455 RepID=A0ABV2JTN5_9GAMM